MEFRSTASASFCGHAVQRPIQLDPPRREHVPVSSVLQWDHRWSQSPLRKIGQREQFIQQAERGRREIGDRSAMPYYGSGSGETGRSLTALWELGHDPRPMGARGLVWPDTIVMRMMQPAEHAAATGVEGRF